MDMKSYLWGQEKKTKSCKEYEQEKSQIENAWNEKKIINQS